MLFVSPSPCWNYQQVSSWFLSSLSAHHLSLFPFLRLSPGSVSPNPSSVRVVTAEMFSPSLSTKPRPQPLTPGNYSKHRITALPFLLFGAVISACKSLDKLLLRLLVYLTACLSHSSSPQVLSPSMSGPPNVQPRRSSRLFTSASSTAKVPPIHHTALSLELFLPLTQGSLLILSLCVGEQ